MIATLLAPLLFSLIPDQVSIDVGGVSRTFRAYIPAGAGPHPVVFGFHGHGGSDLFSARKYKIESLWPEAVVLYPLGLPTPGMTDPEGKKNGWQKTVGDMGDRDLKFFDAMVTWVKAKTNVDSNRIFTMGHSNGAAFSYLLWATHPGLFAAVGPSAATARGARQPGLKPVPIIHVAGTEDPLVKYNAQTLTINMLKRLNGCDDSGRPYASSVAGVTGCVEYPSKSGTPIVLYTYNGDHTMPETAVPVIIEFFKKQRLGK